MSGNRYLEIAVVNTQEVAYHTHWNLGEAHAGSRVASTPEVAHQATFKLNNNDIDINHDDT